MTLLSPQICRGPKSSSRNPNEALWGAPGGPKNPYDFPQDPPIPLFSPFCFIGALNCLSRALRGSRGPPGAPEGPLGAPWGPRSFLRFSGGPSGAPMGPPRRGPRGGPRGPLGGPSGPVGKSRSAAILEHLEGVEC